MNSPSFPRAQARDYTCSLRLKSKDEWQAWSSGSTRPSNIPSNAAKVYRDAGWQGTLRGHAVKTSTNNQRWAGVVYFYVVR